MVVVLCTSATIFAQTKLTGKVVDETSQPLPGASIVVKGSSTGVSTDFDGAFKINAKPFASRSSGSGGVRICAREGRCIV